MGWPQIVMIVLMTAGVVAELALHNKPKTIPFNVWTAITRTIVLWFILYSGGFFS